ncbi:hypothetical protein GOQ27_03495 [Clostridium sp. D2Q-11]|uniref:Uncharacterized protein n=1 Tax=Anaeromonas frigoriresistens TaxID=2683708 RepID=A0A942UT63_9FIRM|nr:DUF6483 family protein [Anaeromonas frigoriresistens]MBS4537510.1 hypothetical protein [Anaeromonas frigoriresistens]
MFQQDYVMRMIRDIIRFLAKVLLKKDTVYYEFVEKENYTQTDYLHKELITLIQKGKINEAENLLFKKLDPSNKKHIELALDFYQRLNSLDDKFLEDNDFSREEIEDGVKEIAKKFGISI